MAERVEIRAKQWKLWLFLAGTLAFGAVGLAQIVLQPPGAWFSWACFLLFGVWGTISFTRQLRAKRAPLTVDAYAVQHPGVEQRRTIQSVAVHLMTLAPGLRTAPTHAPDRSSTHAWSRALTTPGSSHPGRTAR